ncbi:hypothetical protein [Dyella sp. ASV21]|uniref:hypothetical protein n=1 Tax=Dyella sp. ASV21 TaxID=2795114 RepID=UPI0018ED9D77|nr:hypothetical protein [Dyella sp. ASV21]
MNAFFHPEPEKPATPQTLDAPAQPAQNKGGGDSKPKRPDDLVGWLKPRIAGQPWTAPAYDDRQVVSEPEVYCIAADDGRCSCITEQGTKYAMDHTLCRLTASEGNYNPTRRPSQPLPVQPAQTAVQGAPVVAAAPVSSMGGESDWKSGVGAQQYQPPGSMPWNSDPFGGGKRR